MAERAFTRALGGTCHSPIAAHGRIDGGDIIFAAEILSEDGSDHLAETARFAVGDLDTPARLAARMLAEASPSIRRLFEA
jgi:hydroxymethylbilane synthase